MERGCQQNDSLSSAMKSVRGARPEVSRAIWCSGSAFTPQSEVIRVIFLEGGPCCVVHAVWGPARTSLADEPAQVLVHDLHGPAPTQAPIQHAAGTYSCTNPVWTLRPPPCPQLGRHDPTAGAADHRPAQLSCMADCSRCFNRHGEGVSAR